MAKEDKKEETLVMVGDGIETPETEEESAEGSQSEEKKEVAEEAAEDEDGDERVGHEEEEGGTDKEREAIRTRRRQERKNRREKDARLRREVNFLRTRNEQLERTVSQVAIRQDQQELLSIDQRINLTEGQIRQAEEIHATAVKNANGEVATEALRVKDSLNEDLRKLKDVKEERSKKPNQSATTTRPQPPQATIEWVKQNDWFDPSLRDETSHLVKVMEDRLAAEQELDPSTPEYWAELNRRIDARFPTLRKKPVKKTDEKIFDDDEEDGEPEEKPAPKKKNGGPRFSVNGQSRPLRKNEVFISAERRKALEEAGVWDDEELRKRYLKSYQKYDEEARNNK